MPSVDHALDYFSGQKKIYALNVQAAVDARGRFRYFTIVCMRSYGEGIDRSRQHWTEYYGTIVDPLFGSIFGLYSYGLLVDRLKVRHGFSFFGRTTR